MKTHLLLILLVPAVFTSCTNEKNNSTHKTQSVASHAQSSEDKEITYRQDISYQMREIDDKSGLRERRNLPIQELSTLDSLDVKQLQMALYNAKEGDTIFLESGVYHLANELIISEVNGITLQGKGMGKTIINFADQQAGGQGINVNKANNITLCDFSVYDAHGDGIKTKGCNNMIMRNLEVLWTKGPHPTNGGYGLYPVESQGILVEQCMVAGASDAGIYVGQSLDVVVKNCYVYHNVAGIEIENCTRSLVYDNVAEDNTGGILVFNLPDLPVNPDGQFCQVYDNIVVHNNHLNFAPEGNMVAIVAPGSGIVLLAAKSCEVFNNEIRDNKTMGVAVASYFVHNSNQKSTDQFSPYSSNISIRNNEYSCDPSFYADNSTPFGLLVLTSGNGGKGFDLLSDGVFSEDGLFCVQEDSSDFSFMMLNNGDFDSPLTRDAGPLGNCQKMSFPEVYQVDR